MKRIKFDKSVFLILMVMLSCSCNVNAVNISNGGSIHIGAGISIYTESGIKLENGASIDNSGTIIVAGDWMNDGNGLVNSSPGAVILKGTGTQIIGGTSATTFYDLTVYNVSGINNNVSLANDIAISGTLTFLNGNVATSEYNVALTSSAGISGASKTTGWINGNLKKEFATAVGTQTFEFPVGDVTAYTPATLDIKNVNTAGGPVNITGYVSATDANEGFGSGIDQVKKCSHYWFLNLNNNAGNFDSYDITLDFTNTTNGGSTADYFMRKFYASAWSPVNSTVTGTTIKANELTSFGDFEVGELLVAGTLPMYHIAGVDFYPNPVKDIAYIHTDLKGEVRIVIYNALGQLQYVCETSGASGIDLRGLNPGVYFAKISNKEGDRIIKFAKE